MKQEEVDLIYTYLHENFEYLDGDFIRKIAAHGTEVGRKMGCVKIHPEGYCYLVGAFTINKKDYNKRISHLVYLYHFKEFPKYIRYIDGNKMNTRIENLIKTRIRQDNIRPRKFYQGTKIKYRVDLIIEGYLIYLGSYYSEKFGFEAIEVLQKYATDYSLTPQEIENKTRHELGLEEKYQLKAKQRELPEGVEKDKKRYRSRIRIGGKRFNLGSFDTSAEAYEAYLKEKEMRINRVMEHNK